MRAPKLLLLLAVAAAAPLLSLSLRATAEPSPLPAPSAASAPAVAAPSASPEGPAASAATSASAAAAPKVPKWPPLLESLAGDPLPGKPTPMPAMKDWKNASLISVEPGHSTCETHRIREWLHVHCGFGSIVDVSLLSGEAQGVAANLVGDEFTSDGDLVLPLRRGRSYVASVTSLQMGRYSSGLPETVALLWVLWPEGQELPTVRLE